MKVTTPLKLELLGTISSREAFYVERAEDMTLRESLRSGRWVEIFGPRLIGKSSLFWHQKFVAEKESWAGRFILIDDVKRRLKEHQETAYDWCLGLADVLAEELKIESDPLRAAVVGKKHLGPMYWLQSLFAEGLRPLFPNQQIVLAFDECDRLFEGQDGSYLGRKDFGAVLAHVFRGLMNARELRLAGFTLVFIGQRRISDIVGAHSAAATGLGEPLLVRDFTQEDWRKSLEGMLDASLARDIWELSRGHPRLSIELLEMARKKLDLNRDQLKLQWVSLQAEDEEKSSVVKSIRKIFKDEAAARPHDLEPALKGYREEIRTGSKSRYNFGDREVAFLLDSGLVRRRADVFEVTAPLLAEVFDDKWAAKIFDRLRKFNETTARISKAEGGKHILIINTGGTIGMFYDRQKNAVREASPEEFKRQYRVVFNDPSFTAEFEQLFAYDSINVHPPQWSRLARYIWERRSEYDAFIVAHGTDTMAFSASAVAFALGEHLDKPVIFTGAQATVDLPHSDAIRNLYEACLVARKNIPEVVVCFGNKVFRACRAMKMDEKRFDAFESPNYPELAIISEVVELRERFLRESPSLPVDVNVRQDIVRKPPEPQSDWVLRADFEPEVLLIQLSPGMDTHFFNLDATNKITGRSCQGIVIRTLGSGNIPTEPIDYREFARTALEDRAIPVLISSQYPWHPETHEKYAPGSAAVESGAILTPTMTPAAAETKFRWALAQVLARGIVTAKDKRDAVKAIMEHNYVGELEENLVGANLPSHLPLEMVLLPLTP